MKKFKRVFLIVMDSVGIGHALDAEKYGDKGSNTFLHIDQNVEGGLKAPNLEKLGWGVFDNYRNILPENAIKGAYTARLSEKSLGKDTMTGHWEIMGLHITKPFQTFTDTGFPKELIDELSRRTGHGIIGNISASGTEIIRDLGEEHLKTKDLIVYTSADSVLQIAANENIVPIEKLYEYCEIARELTMKDEWKVGRIIARPFIGDSKDNFKRTARRHDYALSPFGKTYMNYLKDAGYDVIAVGKINDIFNTEGVTEAYKTVSNDNGMDITIDLTKKDFNGLCFVNLVDFDMEYGHRRNVEGYAKSIEDFDKKLEVLLESMNDDDLLILTADHGNDPTWTGSDHTRENVPFVMYSKSLNEGGYLNEFDTFGVIGSTVADNFGIEISSLLGDSLLDLLK
ncbi:MAG: phosphopentomutase [Bacilli bacterium]|nr:phosphopentomutase [Bacilli bacterium]